MLPWSWSNDWAQVAVSPRWISGMFIKLSLFILLIGLCWVHHGEAIYSWKQPYHLAFVQLRRYSQQWMLSYGQCRVMESNTPSISLMISYWLEPGLTRVRESSFNRSQHLCWAWSSSGHGQGESGKVNLLTGDFVWHASYAMTPSCWQVPSHHWGAYMQRLHEERTSLSHWPFTAWCHLLSSLSAYFSGIWLTWVRNSTPLITPFSLMSKPDLGGTPSCRIVMDGRSFQHMRGNCNSSLTRLVHGNAELSPVLIGGSFSGLCKCQVTLPQKSLFLLC